MVFGLDDHFYKFVLPVILIETGLFSYAFVSDVRTRQVVLGLLGLWWCLAALWVEIRLEKVYPGFQYDNPPDKMMTAYKPFCDFAPWATCSKVLMSPPGRFLRYFGLAKEGGGKRLIDKVRGLIDVPNPSLGVLFFGVHLFYPLLLLIPLPFNILSWLFFAGCVFVGGMTCWLAYGLAFVLRDFCVVCVSMYVANFAAIPMMYTLARETSASTSVQPFFGKVPVWFWSPFLVLDFWMLLGVLGLWTSLQCERAHAREGTGDNLEWKEAMDEKKYKYQQLQDGI